ncbi:hypothetical protein LUZ63_005150 [Rhynchospora breviuscula]|uniref:Mannan endo-1,4-beta-mannosidase n=1 Tax=Rhynchospora breviuscula TaxID=2022672 RepID=A0A9Q0CMA9_9POAL|nr:hypothetical protein LUZ63_005150 [Rhynchospora breviuscula]
MSPLFLPLFLLSLLTPSYSISPPSFPLSTNSRWIVDSTGQRVKLACVNWAAHLEPVAAEGLSKQPVDYVAKMVADLGFNCVRFTWAVQMVTNASVGSITLRQSLVQLGLNESVAGVGVNNPQLLDLSLVQVYQEVVSGLARQNLMVILDNQLSKPGWCCSRYDGDGFFGDKYFDIEEWFSSLKIMATMFNNTPNVVGMSLRNELRGPNQNLTLWYRYMQEGAELLHSINPNLLVILSGLDYDKDLSFLLLKQPTLTFTNKLVYELHWYGFSDGGDWENGNPNNVCASVVKSTLLRGGFLLGQGRPLFLSEFGFDQSGTHLTDNRYLTCFLSVAAEWDLDWALWALQGSYYLRQGEVAYDESYGLLTWDWCKARNPTFMKRISALQSPLQGPGLSNKKPYNLIFHPLSGFCVLMDSPSKPLQLGSCADSRAWNYTSDGKLMVKGTGYCLQSVGVGKNAKIGTNCSKPYSKWELLSNSSMHISSKLHKNGTAVCLDVGSDGTIITNGCKCLTENGTCSPESQWFKIIVSSRDFTGGDSNLELPLVGSWLSKLLPVRKWRGYHYVEGKNGLGF